MYGNKNCYNRKTARNAIPVDAVMKGPQVRNIFCGPVTLKEIKMRMEMDQRILERRKLEKLKTNAIKPTEKESLKVSSVVQENKENIPAHSIDGSGGKKCSISHLPLTMTNVSQLDNDHDDSKTSSNTSHATYTLENSDPQITSPTHALNSTYDKLEEIECNDQENLTHKDNIPVATLKPSNTKNFQTYRQNVHDSIASEISLCVDKTVEHSAWEAPADINQTNKTILRSFDNLQVDDTCGSSPELSMNLFKDSPMAKALLNEEYLSEMLDTYSSPVSKKSRSSSGRRSIRRSISQPNVKPRKTPGKISDTLITDLTAEQCLINTTFRDSTDSVKSQSTPDVFRKTTNDMWKPKGGNVTVKSQTPKSRIPLKKTPSKYHAIQSPIRQYIREGVTVQSMSKSRHADCSKEPALIRSKSETKVNSKIPQYNPNQNVKKKLDLSKIKKDTSSASFVFRRSTFRN